MHHKPHNITYLTAAFALALCGIAAASQPPTSKMRKRIADLYQKVKAVHPKAPSASEISGNKYLVPEAIGREETASLIDVLAHSPMRSLSGKALRRLETGDIEQVHFYDDAPMTDTRKLALASLPEFEKKFSHEAMVILRAVAHGLFDERTEQEPIVEHHEMLHELLLRLFGSGDAGSELETPFDEQLLRGFQFLEKVGYLKSQPK